MQRHRAIKSVSPALATRLVSKGRSLTAGGGGVARMTLCLVSAYLSANGAEAGG
jgi:hypothetical protein